MDKEDNVISFSNSLLKKFESGKISYDSFSRYEMVELGFDPNNPEDVEEYKNFIDSLQSIDFDLLLSSNDNDKEE